MTAETRHTTRQKKNREKVNNIADLHRQSNQRLPKAYQLRRTFAARHTESSDSTQRAKQNDSTRNFNKSNQHHGQTPWPGNHEYKPWPGYNQARLL
jgi:hypothetical protein